MAKARGKRHLSKRSTKGFKAAIKIKARNKIIKTPLKKYKSQRANKKITVKIMVRWEISIFLGIFSSVPDNNLFFHFIFPSFPADVKPFDFFVFLKPGHLSSGISMFIKLTASQNL